MTLSTVLFTNKKLFEMFIPFYKNSKIQVEVIFEPKINRIVLIPDQEKLNESKLDFDYIYNELKTILIKKDKNLLLYSKIHIQLNKKHALISPHNKMTPIKKYKIMNLNLENINTADYNQNQNFDFDLINKIKNENELITHLSFIQNISFKDSWGYSPNSQNDIRKKIKSNNNITNGIIFAFKSKPVGFVWLTKNIISKETAYISMIGTHPDFTGKGIATDLLKYSIRYLKNNKYKILKLEVDSDNVGARNVYKKFNFKDEETKYWFEFSRNNFI